MLRHRGSSYCAGDLGMEQRLGGVLLLMMLMVVDRRTGLPPPGLAWVKSSVSQKTLLAMCARTVVRKRLEMVWLDLPGSWDVARRVAL